MAKLKQIPKVVNHFRWAYLSKSMSKMKTRERRSKDRRLHALASSGKMIHCSKRKLLVCVYDHAYEGQKWKKLYNNT